MFNNILLSVLATATVGLGGAPWWGIIMAFVGSFAFLVALDRICSGKN